MATEVGIGIGAEFWLDSAGDVLTQLSEILSVALPNSQVADVEATHMASPNRRREYVAGLIDDGEGTVEMNYVPGSDTDILLRAALADGETRDYKVVLPVADGSTWEVTGDCIVKGYERNAPIDDRMTATLTIRFTGSSSEAAGA
jgi:predicted secreted protein